MGLNRQRHVWYVDPPTRHALRVAAATRNVTMNQFITDVVRRELCLPPVKARRGYRPGPTSDVPMRRAAEEVRDFFQDIIPEN